LASHMPTARFADHAHFAGISCADGGLASRAYPAECDPPNSSPELPFPMTTRIARDTRLILIGAGVLLSLGMGLRQSLGLFLTPVTRDLALTAADFTLSLAIQNIVWGLSQAPIGAIADRFGLRITMMAGAVIYVVGLGIMAAAGGVPALLVSGVFVGVALSCTASSLAMTAVARAVPEHRRSSTLGIVAAGGSLGTLMVPLVTQGLLANWAWQIGALFFVALAAAMLPAAFLAGGIDRVPHHGGASRVSMREMLGQAMRHRQFLVLSGAYFVCGLNLVFLATHLPTYLTICGQDPMLAAEAIAVIGGMNCVGSLAAGWLGSKYPKHVLLGGLYILRAFVFTAYFMMPPTRPAPRYSRGDGHVVAQRRAFSQRPRRRDVRHPLHGDVARHRVCDAPGRVVARRVRRRADLRPDRLLRRRLEDRRLDRLHSRRGADRRRRPGPPPRPHPRAPPRADLTSQFAPPDPRGMVVQFPPAAPSRPACAYTRAGSGFRASRGGSGLGGQKLTAEPAYSLKLHSRRVPRPVPNGAILCLLRRSSFDTRAAVRAALLRNIAQPREDPNDPMGYGPSRAHGLHTGLRCQ
jgi:MFS family permease